MCVLSVNFLLNLKHCVGSKAFVCADQVVTDISAVLHGRLQRDTAQVQEHGGEELRLSLTADQCIQPNTSLLILRFCRQSGYELRI